MCLNLMHPSRRVLLASADLLSAMPCSTGSSSAPAPTRGLRSYSGLTLLLGAYAPTQRARPHYCLGSNEILHYLPLSGALPAHLASSKRLLPKVHTKPTLNTYPLRVKGILYTHLTASLLTGITLIRAAATNRGRAACPSSSKPISSGAYRFLVS